MILIDLHEFIKHARFKTVFPIILAY